MVIVTPSKHSSKLNSHLVVDVLLGLLALVATQDTDSSPEEVRLMRHLLEKIGNQSALVPPRLNNSYPVGVKFGLRLVQVSLSEKLNVLETSAWCRYKWMDHLMRWDPKEFGNLKRIIIPHNKIWLPEISLVNTGDSRVNERYYGVSLGYAGTVFWVVHRVYKSACHVDLSNYPYDKHTCHLWFQSLINPTANLDPLVYGPSPPFDLSTYLGSYELTGEWKLHSNQSERFKRSRDIGVALMFSRRPSLRFSITLDRQAGFTSYLLMLPCLLLTSLTLIVFCLPPERPDRNAVATSLFGSFMLLTLVLVQVAPPVSSVPKLVIVYASNMILIVLAIAFSALVGRIRAWKGPMPSFLKTIVIHGIGCVMLRCTPHQIPPRESKHPDPEKGKEAERRAEVENIHLVDMSTPSKQSVTPSKPNPTVSTPATSDWILLGVIIDRLLILIYMICIVVIFANYFPRQM